MKNKEIKPIKAYAFLYKRKNSLLSFAMPVKDFSKFLELAETTKRQMEDDWRQVSVQETYKVIPVLISPIKNSKKKKGKVK